MRSRVLLALLLATGCSGGGDAGEGPTVATTGAPAAQTLTVEMNDALDFLPSRVAARVGTVTFDVRNVGRVPHDLTFDDEALGRTPTVDGKQSAPLKVVFREAGAFRFVCTLHPGMDGEVVVS